MRLNTNMSMMLFYGCDEAAILLPETDTDLEPIEEGEAQSLPK